MNAFMPRMLFLSCITLSLILSGCGPKEIEPYQGATEAAGTGTSGRATTKTYPLGSSSYSTFQDEQGQDTPVGSIAEEDLEPGEAASSAEAASLAEALPMPETTTDTNTTIVETLDAGSKPGEQKLSFGDQMTNQSAAYKKEHGRSSIQLRPVYFDFDNADIRKNQVAAVEHNADYLKSNVASKVLVEGNCDELGTNEYNLALGQRRAMNARNYLIKLGVDGSRIRTVSYGEERPLFTGSEESDYAYNRRDDFVLE